MRRNLLHPLMVAVIVCGVITTSGTPANAQLSRCGTGGNWFDGFAGFPAAPHDTYEGVQANVEVQSAQVCDSDRSSYSGGALGNFVYAWSMIASHDGVGWSQSGYFRSYGTGLLNFSQVNDGHGYLRNATVAGPAPGSTHTYWQQYIRDGTIRSNVDGTILQIPPFNPYFSWAFPFSPQFFAEARYRESDVPGSSGNPVTFSSLTVQRSADDSFVTIPGDVLNQPRDDSGRWNLTSTGATSFDINTR